MIPPDLISYEDLILTDLDAFQSNFLQDKLEKHTSLPGNLVDSWKRDSPW